MGELVVAWQLARRDIGRLWLIATSFCYFTPHGFDFFWSKFLWLRNGFLGSVVHTGREAEGQVAPIDFASRCLVLSLGLLAWLILPPANRPDQA